MINSAVQAQLGKNVLELTFVRRHKKPRWSDIRGLFGTTNPEILNSDFGNQVLRFKPPIGVGMGYDYKSKNLCVVWDIFRQEYRVFGAEQTRIRKSWDVSSPEKIEEFKQYFYEYIYTMSEQDKLDFMGYVGQYQILQSPKISPNIKEKITKFIHDTWTNFLNWTKKFSRK